MLTKAEYVAESQKRLDDWNAEIDALEAKAGDISDINEGEKAKYQEELVALRAKREEGEKRLAEIQSADESSWENLKAGTENVWEALKESVKTFQAHLK